MFKKIKYDYWTISCDETTLVIRVPNHWKWTSPEIKNVAELQFLKITDIYPSEPVDDYLEWVY